MKFIEQSSEVWLQDYDLDSIYKIIERSGRMCYSPETEVLTNKGWKFINTINEDDLVLTYNPSSNNLIYNKPNIIQRQYNGNMIYINHPMIKLLVTPEHRIYQSVPSSRNYSFLTAAQLAGINEIPYSRQSKFRIPKYFKNSFYTPVTKQNDIIIFEKEIKHGFRHSTIERITVPINSAFMTILGAYIAEGHTIHGEKYRTGSRCIITQTENTALYNNVIKALKDLQWHYNITQDNKKPYIKRITFGNQVFVKFFDELVGRGSYNKHLPEWFRNLPIFLLKILLHNMYLGDRSHNKTRHEKYISMSLRLLNEVQEAFILLGKNGTVQYDNTKSQKCYFEETYRDSWIIDRNKHISLIPYNGNVYCTNTNTGIICIRYKGKTCWCGNCYKSEDKATENSAKEFVERLIKNGHGSVLEQGTVYLTRVTNYNDSTWEWYKIYDKNPYSKANFFLDKDNKIHFFITTNYRVIIENDLLDDLKYLSDSTEYHTKRVSMHIICSRAIANELVRHRVFSFIQESSRYCNYSKNKFGNELTFIKPVWYDKLDTDGKRIIFMHSLQEAEETYMNMVSYLKPQDAREVLPLCTKTELVMTGFLDDWKEFFKLRIAPQAHPQMRELASNMKQQISNFGFLIN